MNGKIKIHLTMLVSFMLCNISSTVLAAYTAIAAEDEMSMPHKSGVPAVLRFEGDVVEVLPSSKATSDTASLRCKRFEWLGNAVNGVTNEARLNPIVRAPGIDATAVCSSGSDRTL